MQDMPCGFGEEPFIFPPDTEIQSMKKECKQQEKKCENNSCQVKCCKEQNNKQQKVEKKQENKGQKTKNCFKCKTEPGSIVYKGESMCKACSLRNVEYKCRVNLQNKIKINEKDRVVICLSGGMNSICLTNILVQLRKKFQKHLLFKSIEVVHVDLSMLSDNQQQYIVRMKRLNEFCKSRQVELKIISLSELIEQKQLKQLLNSFGEGANQADIVDIFIQRLIASHYSDCLVALGTSGQRTASNILKFIVKGQGGSLEQLSWRNEQRILPLRQHLAKQLQFYFYMNKLDQFLLQAPSVFSKKSQSDNKINEVLQDFIDSLQDTYSHTCPTILRTSEKIKANKNGLKCTFCSGLLNQSDNQICLRCKRLKEYVNKDIGDLLPKGFTL